MKRAHPSWIEIDLRQFRRNLEAIRAYVGRSRICLPVKANAYGHGLVEVAKAAVGFVDIFGVSCLKEGVRLKEAGIGAPVLVFGAIHEEQVGELVQYGLELSISSKRKAEMVPAGVKVHLEVDTGMQRTGVRPETAVELMPYLKERFDVVGVYSHLASKESSPKQIADFKKLLERPEFQGVPAHLANSEGVVHFKEAHLDMVRPGLLAYGHGDLLPGIGPCFSLKSKVSYFKVVEAGTGIGYGHTYVTKERTRIVTVPVGYGDGYSRALSNRGEVVIRGKRYPIVGTICMDQFMVDVGDDEVYVGDEVVLIGKEIPLEEIAGLCDTIPYEILCLFNDRIPREYVI